MAHTLRQPIQAKLRSAGASEACAGISIKAPGFAGVLLVRDEEQLATLRRVGPVQVLQGVTA